MLVIAFEQQGREDATWNSGVAGFVVTSQTWLTAPERNFVSFLPIGVFLPSLSDRKAAVADPVAAAVQAESLGFESVWVVDQLVAGTGNAILDSTLVLAGAAAVTERIGLALGVLIVPLRQSAWIAKQVATLQHLSGSRLVLGVGVGGDRHDGRGRQLVCLDPSGAAGSMRRSPFCPISSPARKSTAFNSHPVRRCRRSWSAEWPTPLSAGPNRTTDGFCCRCPPSASPRRRARVRTRHREPDRRDRRRSCAADTRRDHAANDRS